MLKVTLGWLLWDASPSTGVQVWGNTLRDVKHRRQVRMAMWDGRARLFTCFSSYSHEALQPDPAECSISTEPCHDTGGLIKITLINQERSQTSSLKMSCFSLLLFIYFPPRVLPLLVSNSAIFHPGNSPPALFPILTRFVSLDPLPHSHTHV